MGSEPREARHGKTTEGINSLGHHDFFLLDEIEETRVVGVVLVFRPPGIPLCRDTCLCSR